MPVTQGGYGSMANPAPAVNGDYRAFADEAQHLLGQDRKPTSKTLRNKLTMSVNREGADMVLLACYIITGLLDSSSISIWGSFVSMQTGNTVYIGLGLAAPTESTRWIKSATSLGSFCLGSFFFSRFHRLFSPRRRWVLCASFLVQTLLCFAAATILTFGPRATEHEISWNVLAPIALIAFQSCGQAFTSRALQYNVFTTVVLTSIYIDLFADPQLFALGNGERNRRVAAPVLLLSGAVLGGLFAHSSLGIAGALWTAAFFKFLVGLTWFYWPGGPDSDDE